MKGCANINNEPGGRVDRKKAFATNHTHTQIDAEVTHKIFFGAYCNFKHRCRYGASAKPPEFFTPNLIASTSDGTKFSIESSSVPFAAICV